MTGIATSDTKRTSTPMVVGALLLITLVGMALRLYRLDATSLDGDELYTANWSRLDPRSIVATTARDVHPPLMYMIARTSLLLLGPSDFVLRLPAALFGSLSVLVVYKAGQVLWGRREGLVGAFLLAIAPYHVQFSQYARHYALLVFLALLSLIFMLKALHTGRKALWIGFALCTVAGLYNVYFAGLVLGIEVMYALLVIAWNWLRVSRTYAGPGPTGSRLLCAKPRRQALMLGLTLALVGLLLLPWLPTMFGQFQGNRIGFEGFGGATMPRASLSAEWFQEWLTTYSSADGARLMLLLGLFAMGLVTCGRKQVLLIALWLASPFMFAFVVSAKHNFAVRAGFYILPVYLLVIARGIASSARLASRIGPKMRCSRGSATRANLALAAIVLAGLNLGPLREYYSRQHTDWRGTARYLAEHLMPQDVLIADGVSYKGCCDSTRVTLGLPYHLAARDVTDAAILHVGTGLWQNLQERVEQGPGRVWGVLWYSGDGSSWRGEEHARIIDFPGLLIIQPPEPSGYMVQDAVSTLSVLLDLMPTKEGCFDIHLALADLYRRTGRLADAQSELEKAVALQPDDPRATADLQEALLKLERSAQSLQDIPNPMWCDFGHMVALIGYEIHPPSAGASRSVDITLWWKPLAHMDRDYTGFVHAVDDDGHLAGQEDRLLQSGDRRTSKWRVGEVVRDEYRLSLPSDAEAGQHVVITGVYYWETGERLPVWDAEGQRLGNDAITLGTITVGAPTAGE